MALRFFGLRLPVCGIDTIHHQPPVSAMQKLCRLSDLDRTGAKGMTIERDGQTLDVFVVRHGGRVHGFVDHCPHAGATLAWIPDRYLDETGEYLICATHGALFDIASGACVGGPCGGKGLTPLPVSIVGDEVVLETS